MSEAPEQQLPADKQAGWRIWWRSVQATPTQRTLLLTALGGLLIAGISTALPAGADERGRLIGHSDAEAVPAGQTFADAEAGDCLNWPTKSPDQATIVDCKDDHRFEVALSLDLSTFPGSEYGPNAAAPSPSRIQQISQEQCQASVERYLGIKYDPNSKFTVGMLWRGAKAWSQSDERRMLCGLQLQGAKNEQQAFKGKVAELEQSKVWPAGTCIGIEQSTNLPTDVPIDCAGPHAMEVTGSVNVAEKFPDVLPPEADQDAFIKETCTRLTDEYLAPVELRATTMTLTHLPIKLPSWAAGSRQVACLIGATLGNGGWSTLVGSAKGPLLINGQAPVAPPDIPDERLNPLPIPLPTPVTIDLSESQQSQSPVSTLSPGNTAPTLGNQHLPNAPGPQTADIPAAPAPGQPEATPMPPGGPPAAPPPAEPAPEQVAPPPEEQVAPPPEEQIAPPPAEPAPAPLPGA